MLKSLIIKILMFCYKPTGQWQTVSSQPFDKDKLINENLLPSIGLMSLFLFIGNFIGGKSLIINLQTVILYFASYFCAYFITYFIFLKISTKYFNLDENKVKVYIVNSIIVFLLFLGISKLFQSVEIVYNILFCFSFIIYFVAFIGAKVSFKLDSKIALLYSISGITLFLLISEIVLKLLLLISEKTNIDLWTF